MAKTAKKTDPRADEIAELEAHLASPGKSKHCTVATNESGHVEINWESGWSPREVEARLEKLKSA